MRVISPDLAFSADIEGVLTGEMRLHFQQIKLFQRSMKPMVQVNATEQELAHALRAQLGRVPFIEVVDIRTEAEQASDPKMQRFQPDIEVKLRNRGRPLTLIVEVKSQGFPREIRGAIAQVQAYLARADGAATALVGTNWLSPESRRICEEAGVGWLDLAGNFHVTFDGVFIDREAAERPKAATRSFRSIFSPRAARVLRTLLSAPSKVWKVQDLSQASGVSLGHISNVRTALIDREWATVDEGGFRLTRPDALLDAWRDDYEPVRGRRSSWHTILHGKELERALKVALDGRSLDHHAMLGGLSAADWLAPYLRGGVTTIYVEAGAEARLTELLKLKPSGRGANVEIIIPDDAALFEESVSVPGSPPLAPPVMTYLDLYQFDDRRREAAEHLRESVLSWR